MSTHMPPQPPARTFRRRWRLSARLLCGAAFLLAGCDSGDVERMRTELEATKAQGESNVQAVRASFEKQLEAARREMEQVRVIAQQASELHIKEKTASATQMVSQANEAAETARKQADELREELVQSRSANAELRKRQEGHDEEIRKAVALEREQTDRVNQELTSIQEQLTATREALAALRQQHELVLEELSDRLRNSVVDFDVDAYAAAPKHEIVIIYRAGRRQQAKDLCASIGWELVEDREPQRALVCRWTEPVSDQLLGALDRLQTIVESIQPRGRARLEGRGARPSERESGSRTPPLGIDPLDVGSMWGIGDIDVLTLTSAMRRLPPVERIVIAVIDSGVDIDHPFLRRHIWSNPLDPEDGLDNDGNGVIDDTHGVRVGAAGRYFVAPTPTEESADFDTVAHGTHCAGVICATANGLHTADAESGPVSILPIRVDFHTDSSLEDTASAVQYARSHGAQIINLSLSFDPKDIVLRELDAALRAGVLIVCAAGNDGRELGREESGAGVLGGVQWRKKVWKRFQRTEYSLTITPDLLLCATAVGPNGNFEGAYANRSQFFVDVAAPGGSRGPDYADQGLLHRPSASTIISSIPEQLGGQFGGLSGTSQSAAHVSGLAGLVWYASRQFNADWSAHEVRQCVLECVQRRHSSLEHACSTGGVVGGGAVGVRSSNLLKLLADYRLNNAAAAYRRANYSEALRWLAEAEQVAPDSAWAPLLSGVCLILLGRNEEAQAHFERGFEREQTSQQSSGEWLNRLRIQGELRRTMEIARASFRRRKFSAMSVGR